MSGAVSPCDSPGPCTRDSQSHQPRWCPIPPCPCSSSLPASLHARNCAGQGLAKAALWPDNPKQSPLRSPLGPVQLSAFQTGPWEGLCLQYMPASGHNPKLGSQYPYSSTCTSPWVATLAHTSGPHAHEVPLYPLHGSASPACTICLFIPSPWNPAATLLFLFAPLPQPVSPSLCAAQRGRCTQGWHLKGLGDAGVARGGCEPLCARQA